jgi:uncharacterized protein
MLQLAIGACAGLFSGLFGIGGGVLIVPALILLARMPSQTAVGTSLAALLLPVGALGAYQYWQKGSTDLRAAVLIASGMFVGAWLGSLIGLSLPPRLVQRAFAVFLVLVAGQMWWKA